ncbi:MAG TPA: ATP-binding protein [Microvirga sp.]|jgi:predicted kinase|nr:ATP-binding protein [Microvirga sp.]
MPILYAMCGLAFAGKSTAARRVAERLGAGLVGLDRIHEERGLFPGGDLDVANWEETGRIAETRARALLREGRSAVVDDTFSYRRQRDAFRRLAEGEGAGFLVLYVDTPEAVIAARIAANRANPSRADVLPHVLQFIRDEFEPPATDEPQVRFTAPEEIDAWLAGLP